VVAVLTVALLLTLTLALALALALVLIAVVVVALVVGVPAALKEGRFLAAVGMAGDREVGEGTHPPECRTR
jgi:hypothetical protein